ncbi:hypothetical protein CPB85DRAFT_450894 [Mucidula mucida]|nr:hypothetical protein CPB85DRAFT_450894 [Mucidula mucida]
MLPKLFQVTFQQECPVGHCLLRENLWHRSSCELPPRAGGCFLHHIISRVQSRMMDKIDGRVPMANASNDQVYPTLIRGSCYLGSAFPVGFQGVFGLSTAVVRNYSLLRDSPDFICKTRWTDIFEKRGARLIGDLNTTLISMSSDYKTSRRSTIFTILAVHVTDIGKSALQP